MPATGAPVESISRSPLIAGRAANGVGATSREFTARVVAGFQLSNRNAEFWAGPMRMGVVRR